MSAPTAREVVERIRADVTGRGHRWADETVDTFKVGDPDAVVRQVAVTWMATAGAVEAARQRGCNFVITHEPTFWNHLDRRPEEVAADPVYRFKVDLLEEGGITIWRFHDHHHRGFDRDPVFAALIRRLGWEGETHPASHRSVTERTTRVDDLAKEVARALGTDAVRVVGDPSGIVHRVGYGGHTLASCVHAYQTCDAVIVGEAREWDTFEFFRDARALGEGKALIIISHRDLEEWATESLASWVQGLVPEVPVLPIPSAPPFEVLTV